MKSDNQIAERVLARRDALMNDRYRRKRMLKQLALIFLPCGITLALVLTLWAGSFFGDQVPTTTQEPTAEITLPYVEPPTVFGEHYDLSVENGKAYMTLKHPTPPSSANGALVMIPYLTFSSVGEMQEKLLKGTLSEKELATLNTFPCDQTTGKLSVCNLNQLFDLKIQNGSAMVYFYGANYEFTGLLPDGSPFDAELISCDTYYNEIIKNQSVFSEQTDWKILSDNQIEDRNAREIIGESSRLKARYLAYTVENQYGTYTIYEMYIIEHKFSFVHTSNTVPYAIDVYFTDQNGIYSHVLWTAFTPENRTRPSLETLTSFHFVPLNNTSANTIKS